MSDSESAPGGTISMGLLQRIFSGRHAQWMFYVGLSILLMIPAILALGSGWYQQGPWYSDLPYQLFRPLCHQDPARSFWLGGQPMAVCARCLGIYSALATTMLMLPLLQRLKKRYFINPKVLLVVAFAVNVLDFIGNGFGIWSNTNLTRFVLGLMLGAAAVLLFKDDVPAPFKRRSRIVYGE